MRLPEFIEQKISDETERAQKRLDKARKNIPELYHDFIVMLPQNVKISEDAYDNPDRGLIAREGNTYLTVLLPFMTAEGRIKMARDEHVKLGKQLHFSPPKILSVKADVLMKVTIESDLYGSANGTIKVKEDGFEKAEMCCISRALGFLGYGIIGPGLHATAEEVNYQPAEVNRSETKRPLFQSKQEPANLTSSIRVKLFEAPSFHPDGSSSVRVKTEKSEHLILQIPAHLNAEAGNMATNQVILVEGEQKGKDLFVFPTSQIVFEGYSEDEYAS